MKKQAVTPPLSMLILLGALIQLFSFSAHAKDLAVVFGGGCDSLVESKTDKPSFRDLTRTAKSLQSHGWDVRGYYGRKEWLEDFAKTSGIKSAELANKQNLIQSLDHALAELKQGDQFLMVWDTHGLQSVDELGHAICTADDQSNNEVFQHFIKEAGAIADGAVFRIKLKSFLKSLVKNGLYTQVNDPAIRSRLTTLRSRGVKIGIVDDSCYGGTTVLSLGDLACVISGTTHFQKRPDGTSQGVSIALSGVLESRFSASGSISSGERGSLEDAFLLRLLVGKGGRPSGADSSTDAQSSSFLSWLDKTRKTSGNLCPKCEELSRAGVNPTQITSLVSSSQPAVEHLPPIERCRALATKAARAFLFAMGANAEQADQATSPDLIKEVFDEEKCVAYLENRDAVAIGLASTRNMERFNECDGFKL